jgi:hypothetical protein
MKCHACGGASDRAEARCPTCGGPLAVAGGRYVLGEVLGDGAKKRVYRGLDTRLGREVAIAILRTPDAGAASLTALREEAQAMAADRHLLDRNTGGGAASAERLALRRGGAAGPKGGRPSRRVVTPWRSRPPSP